MDTIFACCSRVTPQMIRTALRVGGVERIILHPVQSTGLDELVTAGPIDPLVPEIEIRFTGSPVPLEENVLVPEDQIWFVDKEGNHVAEIQGLAIPVVRTR